MVSPELASPCASLHLIHFYLDLQNSFTLWYLNLYKIGEAEAGISPPELALKLADY
jgi:hypothetical protein